MNTGPVEHDINIYFEDGDVRHPILYHMEIDSGYTYVVEGEDGEHPKWRFYYQVNNGKYGGTVNWHGLYKSDQYDTIEPLIKEVKEQIIGNVRKEPGRPHSFKTLCWHRVRGGIPSQEVERRKVKKLFAALDEAAKTDSLIDLIVRFEKEQERAKGRYIEPVEEVNFFYELTKRGYEQSEGTRGQVFTKSGCPYAIKKEKRTSSISDKFIEDHIGKWNFLRFGNLPVPEEYGVLFDTRDCPIGVVMTAYHKLLPYRLPLTSTPDNLEPELADILKKSRAYGVPLDDHVIFLCAKRPEERILRPVLLDVEHLSIPYLPEPQYRRFRTCEFLI